MVSAAGTNTPVFVSPVLDIDGNKAVPAAKVDTPVTFNVVLAVIAFAASVVLLTVKVPVDEPILTVVAAPPIFKVKALLESKDSLKAMQQTPEQSQRLTQFSHINIGG